MRNTLKIFSSSRRQTIVTIQRYYAKDTAGTPYPGIRGIINGIEGVAKKGDVINTEWFVEVGCMMAVMQMCTAVGNVSEKNDRDSFKI